MSAKSLSWAMEQDGLPTTAKFVLIVMADAASDCGLSFSSNKTICRITGLAKEDTVIGAQKLLIEKGLIKDNGNRKGHTNKVKVFQFHPDACKTPTQEASALFPETSRPTGCLIPHEYPANIPQISRLTDSTIYKELGTGNLELNGVVNPKDFSLVAQEIYDAYPKKVGRPKALEAISKVLRSFPPAEVLEKTLLFAAAWKDSQKEDLTYCPHPATWFNQHRFNDDPETWKRGPFSQKRQRTCEPAGQIQEEIEVRSL